MLKVLYNKQMQSSYSVCVCYEGVSRQKCYLISKSKSSNKTVRREMTVPGNKSGYARLKGFKMTMTSCTIFYFYNPKMEQVPG